MSDLDTAAAILADITGLPVTDPHIVTDAARIAPRLRTTDSDTLRSELISEARAYVRAAARVARDVRTRAEQAA